MTDNASMSKALQRPLEPALELQQKVVPQGKVIIPPPVDPSKAPTVAPGGGGGGWGREYFSMGLGGPSEMASAITAQGAPPNPMGLEGLLNSLPAEPYSMKNDVNTRRDMGGPDNNWYPPGILEPEPRTLPGGPTTDEIVPGRVIFDPMTQTYKKII